MNENVFLDFVKKNLKNEKTFFFSSSSKFFVPTRENSSLYFIKKYYCQYGKEDVLKTRSIIIISI